MKHVIKIINLGAKNCPVGRNGLTIVNEWAVGELNFLKYEPQKTAKRQITAFRAQKNNSYENAFLKLKRETYLLSFKYIF